MALQNCISFGNKKDVAVLKRGTKIFCRKEKKIYLWMIFLPFL